MDKKELKNFLNQTIKVIGKIQTTVEWDNWRNGNAWLTLMNDSRMIGTDLLKEFEHAGIQHQLLSGTPVNNVSDYKQCPLKRENGSQVSLALVYLKSYCKVKSSQIHC